jgi:hypothetical protein
MWIAIVLAGGLYSTPPREADTLRTPSGALFIGGNAIQAPYEFTFDTDSISVNGFVLVRFGPAKLPPAHATPRKFRDREVLRGRVFALTDSLRRAGVSQRSIGRAIGSFIRSSGLVDSVWVQDPVSVACRWRGEPNVVVFDISAPTPQTPDDSWLVRIDQTKRIHRTLSSGGIVLIDEGNVVYVPKSRSSEVLEEIERALSDSLAERGHGTLPASVLRHLRHPVPLNQATQPK